MQFISVYTVPAYNNSMGNFKECNGYFFSNFGDGKYNIDDIKKSSYIGLGHPFKSSKEDINGIVSTEGYVQLKYIGEILNILEFQIKVIKENDEDKIEFVSDLYQDENINKVYNDILSKQQEYFYKLDNGRFSAEMPLEMVLVKTKNYIKINENILHPKRKIVAVPLNLDNNGNYLKLENFLDTIKLTDNISLNIKNNYLIKNGEKIEISGDNAGIYVLILKHIFLSNNKAFSISLFENECKNINVNFKMNYEYLNSSILRGFNKYFKNKLPFEIGFSQNKKLNFNDIKDEDNVFYLKKN